MARACRKQRDAGVKARPAWALEAPTAAGSPWGKAVPGCAEALTQLLHQALSLLVLGDVGEQLPEEGETCDLPGPAQTCP